MGYNAYLSDVRITLKPECGFAVLQNISFISEEGPWVKVSQLPFVSTEIWVFSTAVFNLCVVLLPKLAIINAATHIILHKHYIIVSTQWFKSGFLCK